MTGVFFLPYAAAFLGGILTLALGLIAVRRLLAPPPSNGYVLDINAVRAHATAAQPQQQPQKRAA
jgi:hypothetical protein